MVEADPDAANTDTLEYLGDTVYYNGISTMQAKTELALAQGSLATVLHTAAILLMLLPFWLVRRDGGGPLLAFFAALVVASILAPFPMPLAGGAVSPLVGYGAALALLFLPIRRRIRRP